MQEMEDMVEMEVTQQEMERMVVMEEILELDEEVTRDGGSSLIGHGGNGGNGGHGAQGGGRGGRGGYGPKGNGVMEQIEI